MEPITTTAIGIAINHTLPYFYEKFLDKTIGGVAENRAEVQALRDVVENALAEIDLALDDEGAITQWLIKVGLDRLISARNGRFRRQVARAILTFTDPNSPPPEELTRTLEWPRSQPEKLTQLLVALRRGFASLPAWEPLLQAVPTPRIARYMVIRYA